MMWFDLMILSAPLLRQPPTNHSTPGNLLCACASDGTCMATSAACVRGLCAVMQEGACLGCQCTASGACGESTFVCQRISPAVDSEAVCATVPRTSGPDAGGDGTVGGISSSLLGGIVGGALGYILLVVCAVFVFKKRRELLSDSLKYGKDAESLEQMRKREAAEKKRREAERAQQMQTGPVYRQPAISGVPERTSVPNAPTHKTPW